jgi:EAL domain-containing protein (putative c-di-GMP-specific phosphodiesterase class I)
MSPASSFGAERAQLLARQLPDAIANETLSLVFQPKVRLDTGEFAGVEALVRWAHPNLGNVSPAEFVPLAELSGHIDSLTRWVIEAALRACQGWRANGLDAPLAVNVSACNLGDDLLPDRIVELCAAYGTPPERLTLELTESATQNLVSLMHNLTRLRLRGVGVSIDDFGTGYSSLAQLRALPFTELKVDQCFVRQLGESADSEIIVKAIIDLAHNLGLKVVAEGVESQAAIDMLKRFGSDMVQGYYVSRPLDERALLDWAVGRATQKRSAG